MKVLAFGEILFDVIEGVPFLGGAPLNFSAHLARLGADSFILSRVGEDDLGDEALSEIEQLGVNPTFIQKDSTHSTGTVEVLLNNGQPDYSIIENVAYDFIAPVDIEKAEPKGFDVVYFGTLAQRNKQSGDALDALVVQGGFRHIFFDVNLRKGFFSEEILLNSLRNCTILKVNDEEVNVLGTMFFGEKMEMGNFAARVAKYFGISIVVITTGAKGCLIYADGTLHLVKGCPANIVDTVGADDAFSAAFLYHYVLEKGPVAAAEIANQLGAFVASSRGPIPEYSPEIRKALKIKN